MQYKIENGEIIIIDGDNQYETDIETDDFWFALFTSKGLVDIHYDNDSDDELSVVAYPARIENGYLKTDTTGDCIELTELDN